MKHKAILLIPVLLVTGGAGMNVIYAQAARQRLSVPLLTATRQGDLDKVRLLLRQGANPNVRPQTSAPSFWEFCRACVSGKPVTPLGPTPLLTLLAWDDAADDYPPENAAAVQALVEAGADVNARDADGLSPLMLAVQSNKPATARLLLLHGASVTLAAKDGSTALSLAKASDNPDMIRLLRDTPHHSGT